MRLTPSPPPKSRLRRRSIRPGVIAGLLALAILAPVAAATPATPPGQPATGPGGSDYAYQAISTDRVGASPDGAWLFGPENIEASVLETLPVIVFLHGFTATNPEAYAAWIEHLVRRGAVVIYPIYQEDGLRLGPPGDYIENTFAGVRQALDHAGLTPGHVHLAGHSLGALLAVTYLERAAATGLPPVATLTALAPGGCGNCGGIPAPFGVDLPQQIAPQPGFLAHVVVGSDDTIVDPRDAATIRTLLAPVPEDQRRFVTVNSDRHGEPPLVADHLFPQTGGFGGEIDALDWYGLWRPLDALIACAERGEWCDIALGTEAAALDMGAWSDGVPVTSPLPAS